ncbi:hypothetical protein B0I72DRAFT_133242 [Yarrowia lipolytica]|jgi:E3 ubiquitin-protein ligase synoviolin|uniref:YALI0E06743p n=2 Tax=Yarrowia lipolytica TaxID=4952 RepID=Q6C6S2_YARLI|nr:YALI0E06743p [Yarrowia lipolytica CLIB122]AOW05053.1 hypothetical protein YALI1_E08104g [Yarrowia lipolytica]KAB8286134.1 hypothetical protein BKA91DRAFT_131991 [Yarrowia lipolytica]KAE8171398.1 hypothetical protein BKA90DRAFT_139119 [Yarrowia lipolytica]KAJ8056616.1 hypothetical protein LXG23DRAFT_46097 [Yarrowia lipolytica]QNQ00309.1 ERAD-associated E3 ubiquitin-protein ligase hrd1 [Yarrowia lipolytica]|eukprot:XP_503640.1 YALI0E06743p [Yarrowia lipolytica CLIB122]
MSSHPGESLTHLYEMAPTPLTKLGLLSFCVALIFVVFIFGRSLQRIFFGSLHPREVVHLQERAVYTISEFAMQLFVFRAQLNRRFVGMFATLLFIKGLHWMCTVRTRYVYLEYPNSGIVMRYPRLILALVILHVTDILWIRYCLRKLRVSQSMVVSVFLFEITILFCSLLGSTGIMLFDLVEKALLYMCLSKGQLVKSKRYWLFLLGFAVTTAKLISYLIFSATLMGDYCIPLHIFREFYKTLRITISGTRELIKSRKTPNFHGLYWNLQDASEKQINESNDICVVCRDSMKAGGLSGVQAPDKNIPKVLTCGHIVHFGCIACWSEYSNRCPTCRRLVE